MADLADDPDLAQDQSDISLAAFSPGDIVAEVQPAPLEIPVRLISARHFDDADTVWSVSAMRDALAEIPKDHSIHIWQECGAYLTLPQFIRCKEDIIRGTDPSLCRDQGSIPEVDWLKELSSEHPSPQAVDFLRGLFERARAAQRVWLPCTEEELRAQIKNKWDWIKRKDLMDEEVLRLYEEGRKIRLHTEDPPFESYLTWLQYKACFGAAEEAHGLANMADLTIEMTLRARCRIDDMGRFRDERLSAEIAQAVARDPSELHIVIRGGAHHQCMALFLDRLSVPFAVREQDCESYWDSWFSQLPVEDSYEQRKASKEWRHAAARTFLYQHIFLVSELDPRSVCIPGILKEIDRLSDEEVYLVLQGPKEPERIPRDVVRFFRKIDRLVGRQ